MAMEDYIYPLLGMYMNSPNWFKRVVGGSYAALPSTIRNGSRYAQYLAEASLRDRAEIRNLVHRKMAATLKCALTGVPAYRPYRRLLSDLARPLDVLAQLPLLSKEDIKVRLDEFVSTDAPSHKRLKTATGGSTSTPMVFYLSKGSSRTREYAYMDDFHRRAGLATGDLILAIRGRTVQTAGRKDGRRWMYEPIKRQLILSSDHLERFHMPEYMKVIREWRPRFIQAYPSTIYPLARWLKENPAPDVVSRIQGVMLYSENVLDHHMSLLREVFGCPVLKHYGHSERVLMAASTPGDDRMFFWPQYGYFELVDDDGMQITEPGVLGEIVGTSFDNHVMPFIRYRTGDMAMLASGTNPDLPGFAAVEKIEGRRQEYIVCRDNRLIAVCSMGAAHSPALSVIDSMQFEQRRPGHLIIKVVAPFELSAETRQSIVDAMVAKTQGGCSAELVQVDAIPRTKRGKHQLLVQHLAVQDRPVTPMPQ